jgi:hypothetical protein
MTVCQECGNNVALVGGHALTCSRYEEPTMTAEERDRMRGISPEIASRIEAFSDILNDVVIERGQKSIHSFLDYLQITENDPGYQEIIMIAQMCISVGAGVTVQVLIEQGLIDIEALARAAGV